MFQQLILTTSKRSVSDVVLVLKDGFVCVCVILSKMLRFSSVSVILVIVGEVSVEVRGFQG